MSGLYGPGTSFACPRCGAKGAEPCSTIAGRDHLARSRAERAIRSATPVGLGAHLTTNPSNSRPAPSDAKSGSNEADVEMVTGMLPGEWEVRRQYTALSKFDDSGSAVSEPVALRWHADGNRVLFREIRTSEWFPLGGDKTGPGPVFVRPPDGSTKACDDCGKHVGSFQTAGDDMDPTQNLCAHCYGEPYLDLFCTLLSKEK